MRLPDSRRRDFLTDYLNMIYVELPILAYDTRAAEWHARERARLAATGRTPPFVDGQIAAIAAVNQLTLVSRNVRDFTIFDGLSKTGERARSATCIDPLGDTGLPSTGSGRTWLDSGSPIRVNRTSPAKRSARAASPQRASRSVTGR